jgi:23S rRNA (uracil1939-C5)-methyltransferase
MTFSIGIRQFMKTSLSITGFSHEGRGIAHVDDCTVFVMGALPGEVVDVEIIQKRRKLMDGVVIAVHEASDERVEPLCPHFLSCGGCALQHLSPENQIKYKETWYRAQLMHHLPEAKVTWVTPIQHETEGYRRKSRLSIKYVHKKERVLIGFREVRGRWVQDMETCVVLPNPVVVGLRILSEVLALCDGRERIPQIEMFATEKGIAGLLRHLDPLSKADLERLEAFAKQVGWQLWLQPKGPTTVHPLWPSSPQPLSYCLPTYDVEITFMPGDFIQVHGQVNEAMITQALSWLEIKPGMRCLDLFSGLGNFSLPLARKGAEVSAVEGSAEMVARAAKNAKQNNLIVTHFVEDLESEDRVGAWAKGAYDALILDPPRSGAMTLLPWIISKKVPVLVYVSCNYATFIRDAKYLSAHGYVLTHTGVMDMFPHTEHMEVMGRFLYQG